MVVVKYGNSHRGSSSVLPLAALILFSIWTGINFVHVNKFYYDVLLVHYFICCKPLK